MSVINKELTIINELGIHVRPAGMIVKVANRFKSHIDLSYEDLKVNAKSIIGVMSLGAPKDSIVLLTADGEDAEEVIVAFEILFKEGFGELDSKPVPLGDKG